MSIDLFQDDGTWRSGPASAGDDGSVTFGAGIAGAGLSRTDVTGVNAALPMWGGVIPALSFQKP